MSKKLTDIALSLKVLTLLFLKSNSNAFKPRNSELLQTKKNSQFLVARLMSAELCKTKIKVLEFFKLKISINRY